MKNLLIALQFLTVIPVRIKYIDEKRLSEALVYFPLIGLLLGLILTATNNLLFILGFKQLTIDIILVISLIALTGGLHLDGLADTCDAFLSKKNKDETLKIMRDPHIGVMGVLSVASIVLLKIAFLFSLSGNLKNISLILMCILSRWALVLAMFLFPYARDDGKAKNFIQGNNLRIFSLTTIIAVSCTAAIWQLKGAVLILITLTATYLMGKFINNRINGITGDTLGAINELMETFILFGVNILGRTELWLTW